MKRIGLLLVFFLVSSNAFSQINKSINQNKSDDFLGKVWEIKPGQDYAAILKSLKPGDQLVLHEGVYKGNTLINNSGLPDYPITIRGYGNGEDRPVLLYEGTSDELLKIAGDNLVLNYLKFNSKHTYCIRIGNRDRGSNNITIKNSIFYECGGGDISANYYDVSYDNVQIIDNYFVGSKTTPVYIGSHQGTTPVTRFTFRGNVIDGSQNDGQENSIGYGIQLKLNVTKSVIEYNFITSTKGPGIMVYGSEDSAKSNTNIVRSNIVVNSRNEAGIVVGGGPSVIQNNVIYNGNSGISVQNYGGRNLLENIVLIGNTAVYYQNFGISFGNVKDIIAKNNAVVSQVDSNAFINNPNIGAKNLSYDTSESLQNLTDNVKNIVPLRDNLNKIWLHVLSGPLDKSQLKKLISLISEYNKPTKVTH